ncbi:SHOCT domain-containing protein [Moorella sp. ACPs]|uniref:SHOCT domain-containing protein n=1 Tax=Neomoorella carbonis TaxID=3062783 RepID=UPI00324B1854
MMWGYYGNWGMGLWMLVWWVLVIGILVLAVYGLVSLFNRRTGQQPALRPDPLAILKERYARGEITTDEYHRMREELRE